MRQDRSIPRGPLNVLRKLGVEDLVDRQREIHDQTLLSVEGIFEQHVDDIKATIEADGEDSLDAVRRAFSALEHYGEALWPLYTAVQIETTEPNSRIMAYPRDAQR